jgi:Cu(I)/Ag(I) efflux system membrane protein CusA/SilA
MTVSTVVAGLLPIMWSTQVGAEVMKPLATPVLGGMISSLLHVLIVTPVVFFALRERQLDLAHEALPPPAAHASPRRAVLAGLGAAALIVVAALVAWRFTAPAPPRSGEQAGRVVQSVRSGAVEIRVLAPAGVLRQGRNTFFLEFRRNGTLVDPGDVRASANMRMSGMVMSSGLRLTETDTPGRYLASAEFGMAGAWNVSVEWEGPAGQGSISFEGTVQ